MNHTIALATVALAAVVPASAASGDDWPRVTLVDAAAPDVLHVVVRTGEVVRGKQVPYVPEPGDTVERSIGGAIVMRNGREIGGLAADGKLLFPYERVVQGAFTPERWREATRVRLRSPDDPGFRGGPPPQSVDLKTRPYEVSRWPAGSSRRRSSITSTSASRSRSATAPGTN